MPRVVRVAAFVAFLACVVLGLGSGQDTTDGRWLSLLGAGWLLLLLAAWVRLPDRLPRFNRAVIRTSLVLVTVFAVLSVQMVRIQLVRSSTTVSRVVTAPDGEVLANPRRQGTELAVRRGRVFDANGTVLADTVREGDAWARVYPEPESAPLVGYYSPLRYGTAGLESAFDDELAGRAGGNAVGRWVNELLNRPQEGLDLHLTLDAELQREAVGLLEGRPGAAVVVEVKTGRVVAMASQPGYDPNALFAATGGGNAEAEAYFAKLLADPDRPLVQRATGGQYTPGSIFKVVTAAASIDSGFSDPSTVYEDTGELDVAGRVIVENQNRPDAAQTEYTLTEGLAYSLNVVYAQVGLALGAQRMSEYGAAFGFDGAVPFDLPVAESQLASSPEFLDALPALAETAFGQGELLVSPLHMAVMAGGLANNGRLMRPYLVERVATRTGESTRQVAPSVWREPVSAETAAQVEQMMVDAVETGIASGAQVPGYRVGGKTGTAETGDGKAPHAWFIGFIGDPEPRYAVAVVLENGASASVGVAQQLAGQLLGAAAASTAPETALASSDADRDDDPSAPVSTTLGTGALARSPRQGWRGSPPYVRAKRGLLLLKMEGFRAKMRHAVFGAGDG